MAAIYSLYIINKSGGLIFYKDYGLQGRMDTNDTLRLASLWHSMHAISQQLSPVSGCTGIELLEADTFDLHCFQSLTEMREVMTPVNESDWRLGIATRDEHCQQVTPMGYGRQVNWLLLCFYKSDALDLLAMNKEIYSYNAMLDLCERYDLVMDEVQPTEGTKFFVVSEPGTQHMENLLKHIYELYTDYVLKNPFYEMEMPIRCELFDINLAQAIQKDRVAYLGR
ncbi:trafficking protein particle complex subunit 4-like protein [Tanacetum coccineum]